MENRYKDSDQKSNSHHHHHHSDSHRHHHGITEETRTKMRRKMLANVLFACLVILALIIVAFVGWLYTA